MGAVVIYATIILNNVVGVIEYKRELFKNNEECIAYLQTYNDHINSTLKEHLDKKKYFEGFRDFMNKTQSLIDMSGYGNHFRIVFQK